MQCYLMNQFELEYWFYSVVGHNTYIIEQFSCVYYTVTKKGLGCRIDIFIYIFFLFNIGPPALFYLTKLKNTTLKVWCRPTDFINRLVSYEFGDKLCSALEMCFWPAWSQTAFKCSVVSPLSKKGFFNSNCFLVVALVVWNPLVKHLPGGMWTYPSLPSGESLGSPWATICMKISSFGGETNNWALFTLVCLLERMCINHPNIIQRETNQGFIATVARYCSS